MTNPDTRLAVYEGAAIGTLVLDERNDDDTLGEPRSRVVIDAVLGTTYRVQLGDAPGQAAGRRVLRWYAAPPAPPVECTPDPASFITNPSLEADASGWALTSASSGGGDTFQRYLGDAADGVACAEVAIVTGAGRGFVYTDGASRDWTVPTTITVWLKCAGGSPRPVVLSGEVNTDALVPTGGGPDYTVTPGADWEPVALSYEGLAQTGPLVLTIQTGTGTTAMVLRADCLQATATPTAPEPPTGLACSPAETAIRLAWTASRGATGYYVRRDGALIATVPTPGFLDDPLAPNTTYTYAVSAYTTPGGESSPVIIVCKTTSAIKPVDLSCDALGFLELNGREIANEARIHAYLDQGLGGPSWFIEGHSCVILTREIGVTPRDPAIDPAPWYDAARPESGDFLGMWTTLRVKRHSTRQVAQKLTGLGGAVIGQNRPAASEIEVRAALVSRSSAGADYGRRWLENELRMVSSDPCGLGTARLRLACPPDDGSNDTLGEVFLYDVALAGDVTDDNDIVTTDGCCGVQDVTFVLTAGEASIYHRTQLCAQGTINPDGACVPFNLWLCGPDDGSFYSSLSCEIQSPNLFGAVGVIATINAGAMWVHDMEIVLYGPGTTCPPAPGATPIGVVSLPALPPGSVFVYDSARRILTFYDTASDASTGTNPQPGVPYIEIADGQSIPWLEANPFQPAGCIVIGKRAACGGSATVRVDTQLREA